MPPKKPFGGVALPGMTPVRGIPSEYSYLQSTIQPQAAPVSGGYNKPLPQIPTKSPIFDPYAGYSKPLPPIPGKRGVEVPLPSVNPVQPQQQIPQVPSMSPAQAMRAQQPSPLLAPLQNLAPQAPAMAPRTANIQPQVQPSAAPSASSLPTGGPTTGAVLSYNTGVPYGTLLRDLTPEQYERITGFAYPGQGAIGGLAAQPTAPKQSRGGCRGNVCRPGQKKGGKPSPVSPLIRPQPSQGSQAQAAPRPMPAQPGSPLMPTQAPSGTPSPLPSQPGTPLVPGQGVQSGVNALAGLGMTGPGFTQRNIEIPQPNTREAFLYGTPGHVQQFPRFAPEQEAAMRSLLSRGLQGLSQNPLDFGPIEERARQQFRQETIPGLAERFTALGGGQRSSAFGQQLGRAGADLESQLAALRSQYGLQQAGALTNLARLGLEPSYETTYFPAQPGFAQFAAQGAAQGIPAAVDLLGRAIGNVFSGGSAPSSEAEAAQQIASQIPADAKQAIISGGFERFKNAIWPTLIGAAGGALGTFPLGPAAIFGALLGGGLGLASYLTR